MSIARLLLTSTKNFGALGTRRPAVTGEAADIVRHAPTGDPRLDLAHAERICR